MPEPHRLSPGRAEAGPRSISVIGHRGACGYRPEHTLESYALAAAMGADYLEPDLVCTRDGVLVCRHDVGLDDTTDGTGNVWDYTLAEVKALRARERLPDLRSTAWDGRFEIPTFVEMLELAARLGRGVYPETKWPDEHAARGLALEPLVDAALADFTGPVFLQSFSADSLRALGDWPKVKLLRGDEPIDLDEIATYADAIGPPKQRVDARLVRDAHAAGLEVHPFTFRREPQFLLEGCADWRAEYAWAASVGVDGVFSDNPDLAVACL